MRTSHLSASSVPVRPLPAILTSVVVALRSSASTGRFAGGDEATAAPKATLPASSRSVPVSVMVWGVAGGASAVRRSETAREPASCVVPARPTASRSVPASSPSGIVTS